MCSFMVFFKVDSDGTRLTSILDVKKSSTSKSKVKLVDLDGKTFSHIESFGTLEPATVVRAGDGQCALVAPDIAGESTKAMNQESPAIEV